ncbi:MAG: hypothetical protein LWX02_13450 [Deltaproteobacteria bacterium]|jgi:hypothetical protein|nr:hypothetical protein [Desulfobacterales bacterium]MDL1982436.1 hypothetical protein [Deltaproteobacteria bacterium]MDL1988511.1 hypothetical protein [Deltaproteobacteria bacterium]MDL2123757.1 hypothetical protein [Deltaproteobacteria bacterium]
MAKNNINIQIVWGVVLVLAGIGVFFRIPQVMPKIQKIEHFSSAIFLIRFCFYFLGVLLIGGGAKKIYDNYQKNKN